MITGVEIENFKGIRHRARIELKPLTLLFGPNSGGKSTVLHAMQYAQEVFARHNLDAEQTRSGGGLVDLGGFRNLVHQRDLSRAVRLGFESNVEIDDWDLSPVTVVGLPFTRHLSEEHLPHLAARIIHTNIEVEVAWSELREEPYVRRYAVGINGQRLAAIVCEYNRHEVYLTEINPNHPVFRREDGSSVLEEVVADFEGDLPTHASRHPIDGIKDALPRWGAGLEIDALPNQDWRNLPEDGGVSLDPIAPGTERFVAMFSYLLVSTGERLKDELSFLVYLGPLREVPPRHYDPSKAIDPGRWASGLAAWDELYTRETGPLDLATREMDNLGLVGAVSDWLNNPHRLGVGYELQRHEYKELRIDNPLAVALRTERLTDFEDLKVAYDRLPARRRLVLVTESGMEVQPQDVGIGISQLVPVVVLALKGRVFLAAIEQPELHLHPAVQVRLGDLFIHTCKTGNRLMLIETHSEHLLLRLLRRIRETADGELPPGHPGLKPSELSVVFVEPPGLGPDGNTQGARVHPLRIDDTGEFLDPWPRGFFEERAKELF
jgi:hypothetical protein